MHRYLSWKEAEDGTVPPWWRPKLRFHKRCKNCIRTIPKLPYDEKKEEDVLTTAEDHCYDMAGYLLQSRPPLAEKMREPVDLDNNHPGIGPHGRKKRRYEITMTQPDHDWSRYEPPSTEMVEL